MIDQPRVGIGAVPFASAGDLGLHKARVTQCALSRICGVCASTLGRPLVLVGSDEELARGSFVFPPVHRECAEHALRTWAHATPAWLGQATAPERWVMVTCSSFEFVRKNRDADDRRPTFEPHEVLEELAPPG